MTKIAIIEDDQVINDAALLIQKKGILPLTIVELVEVVREHPIEPAPGIGPGHHELAHV